MKSYDLRKKGYCNSREEYQSEQDNLEVVTAYSIFLHKNGYTIENK
jgi:hypothetical protein